MTRKKGTESQTKKHWKMKEMQLLLELNSEGFTHKEIADHLGRSEKAVQLKISKIRSFVGPTKKASKKTKIDLGMYPIPKEEDAEPFVLTKRHVGIAIIWASLVVAICVAILVERLI